MALKKPEVGGLYVGPKPDSFRTVTQVRESNQFPDKKKRELDFAEVRQVIDQADKVYKEFEIGQREATWHIETDKPIAVALVTDTHFGSRLTNNDKLVRDLDTIKNTDGLYAVTNGDDVDNFNATGKWATGMNENPLPPQIVSRAMVQKLKELDDEGKLGAMSFGNHNDFGEGAGQDWYETFLGGMRCPILDTGGQLHIEVGSQRYDMAIAHKHWGTSKLNPTNAVKRLIDFEQPNADIGFLGHTHQSEGLMFEKGGKERIAVIGGTYKDEDNFARKHGIGSRAGEGGYSVILYPDEKKMTLIKGLQTVGKILKSLR